MAMLKEEVQALWRVAAITLGAALPMILLGRAVTAILMIVGLIFGFMATNGSSLNSTVRMALKSRLLKILGLVYATLLLSSVFSIDVMRSLDRFAQLVGVGVVAFALFVVFREMPAKYTRMALQTLCLSTVVVVVLCLSDAFLNDPRLSAALHGDKAGELYRLSYMSSVLAVLLPFTWGWLLRKDREMEVLAGWFAIPLVLIGFWTVFVCGGRSGWVAVTIAGILFLAFSGRYHNLVLHTRHWLMGAVAVALGPVIFGLVRGMEYFKSHLASMNPLGEGQSQLEIWSFAMSKMLENPITGIGLGAFRMLPDSETLISNSHPHNFLIEIALETGFFGLASIVLLLLYIFWHFFQYAKGELYGLAGFTALVAFFIGSVATTSVFQPWWLIFFVFSAVFAARIGWAGVRK